MAAVGPLWHSGAPLSRPRGRPLGARMHFAVAGHGAFCFAVTIGNAVLYGHTTSLSPKWSTARMHPWAPMLKTKGARIPTETRHPASTHGGFSQRNLNAQSTLGRWAVGVCSTGVERARGGAHVQSIALLAH